MTGGKKIFIVAPTFLPGFKGGGPVQSINNIVQNLKGDLNFYVYTSDRDKGDTEAYTGVDKDTWVDRDGYRIFYSSKKSMYSLRKEINNVEPNLIYLNSFFSWSDSIKIVILNKLKWINRPIILAPRGEFDSGALELKKNKKKYFIKFYKLLRLEKKIIWHATTQQEYENILREIPRAKEIKVAENLTFNYEKLNVKQKVKVKGAVNLVFISRITEKKNLLMALTSLSKIKEGKVNFNIYGPIEDQDYWEKCNNVIKNLPPNIVVNYLGELSHENVIKTFSEHHFFFFPTLGENYGHIISESLISGCPVIISNKTPWVNLEKEKVGWDIDLLDKEYFVEILNYCINLEQENYDFLSSQAHKYAKNQSNLNKKKKSTIELFNIGEKYGN